MPIDELYREVILEHQRRPRRRGLPADSTVREGVNPTCGDEVRIGIVRDGERIADYGFEGVGCAISQASASLLGDAVVGKDAEEVAKIVEGLERMARGEAEPGDDERMGDLVALEGVAKFPMRVKCATLAAKTLRQCFED